MVNFGQLHPLIQSRFLLAALEASECDQNTPQELCLLQIETPLLFLKIGSHVAQTGFVLTVQLSLALNPWSSCPIRLSDGIAGMCHIPTGVCVGMQGPPHVRQTVYHWVTPYLPRIRLCFLLCKIHFAEWWCLHQSHFLFSKWYGKSVDFGISTKQFFAKLKSRVSG